MKRSYKIICFLLILLVDIADLVSDWLFYVDVSTAEKGLVYGKPNERAVKSLLVFSIFGSIGFAIEIVNLGIKLCREEALINVELIGALIVRIEDVPQIAINVFIASCREDPISIFQLSKAVVIVMSILVRFFFCVLRFVKARRNNRYNDRLGKYSRGLTLIGLIIALAGAITVFIFTKAQRNQYGNITFHTPKTVFEERYQDERYFKNANIFFNHASLNFKGNEEHWVSVTSINSIRHRPETDLVFKYTYQETESELRVALGTAHGLNTQEDCNTIIKNNLAVTVNTENCYSLFDPSRQNHSIIFKFSFTPPGSFFKKAIFGDIKFNAIYKTSEGKCTDITAEDQELTIHYYRNDNGVEDKRFYHQKDLTDIKEVWKTGFQKCASEGNLFPQVDENIQVPCEL